jgi:hypothetical protein
MESSVGVKELSWGFYIFTLQNRDGYKMLK